MHSLNMPQSPLQHILGQYYTTYFQTAALKSRLCLSHLCVWDVIGPVTVSNRNPSFSILNYQRRQGDPDLLSDPETCGVLIHHPCFTVLHFQFTSGVKPLS